MSAPAALSDEAAVASLLREQDPDRALTTLFAPPEARAGLQALYAFSGEIARVRSLVSDPLPGEMRFQWWRDLLAGSARGAVEGHPVAAQLLLTLERFSLPRQPLLDLIEAIDRRGVSAAAAAEEVDYWDQQGGPEEVMPRSSSGGSAR